MSYFQQETQSKANGAYIFGKSTKINARTTSKLPGRIRSSWRWLCSRLDRSCRPRFQRAISLQPADTKSQGTGRWPVPWCSSTRRCWWSFLSFQQFSSSGYCLELLWPMPVRLVFQWSCWPRAIAQQWEEHSLHQRAEATKFIDLQH